MASTLLCKVDVTTLTQDNPMKRPQSSSAFCDASVLRARARITWHFAAGPQARWRDASDELYPRWYVRSEQQSQRACGPQPEGARRRVGICFVAAPRRCTPTSPASRRLASAHPALAPKCQLILARALRNTKAADCCQAEIGFIRCPSGIKFSERRLDTLKDPMHTAELDSSLRALPNTTMP